MKLKGIRQQKPLPRLMLLQDCNKRIQYNLDPYCDSAVKIKLIGPWDFPTAEKAFLTFGVIQRTETTSRHTIIKTHYCPAGYYWTQYCPTSVVKYCPPSSTSDNIPNFGKTTFTNDLSSSHYSYIINITLIQIDCQVHKSHLWQAKVRKPDMSHQCDQQSVRFEVRMHIYA